MRTTPVRPVVGAIIISATVATKAHGGGNGGGIDGGSSSTTDSGVWYVGEHGEQSDVLQYIPQSVGEHGELRDGGYVESKQQTGESCPVSDDDITYIRKMIFW